MTDRYSDFAALVRAEHEGRDFAVRSLARASRYAIMAPHGGGIEPGTSELAEAIAADTQSFYAFDGIKPRGNAVLHVTSTRFDEPRALRLAAASEVVIALHGEAGSGEGVYLGGLDHVLGGRLAAALHRAGFPCELHSNPALRGLDPRNLCNAGSSGAGVQIEISHGTRATLFAALNRAGRMRPTPRFWELAEAVRNPLAFPRI